MNDHPARIAALVPHVLGSVIDGKSHRCDKAQIAVFDPATGQPLAQADAADADLVDRAVRSARRALETEWARIRPADRQLLLLKLADLIERDADALAELETLDNGMLLPFARHVSVGAAVEHLRYMAGWATKLTGSTMDVSIPTGQAQSAWAYTIRQPVGVVGAIIPWNVPFLMAVWKLAPALAAGCTVVLKPAEETPLSAIRLAHLVLEAGIPPGVFNVVVGTGSEAGAALVRHPGVAKLAFTGSTATGIAIGRVAMDNLTPCSLELGGKSPVIALADADPAVVGAGAAQAIFMNSGQICTAGSRLYLHKRIYDDTVDQLSKMALSLKTGSGLDERSQLGPLVSEKQQKHVEGMLSRSVEDGAKITQAELHADGGYFVAPTIVENAKPDAEIVREEVFGPVVVVQSFDDLNDVVKSANESKYDLAASLWTNDNAAINQLTRRLRAGKIWINTHNFIDPNLPFGGLRGSGSGREMGREGVEAFTSLKSVCVVSDLDPRH